MATLNLLVNPAGMVAGAQAGEDALEDVAIQAGKTESAVDKMGRNVKRGSVLAGNGMKGLAQQGSQVVDMGLATGQWGKAFFLQMSDIAMVLGGPLTIAAGSAIGVIGMLGLSFIDTESDANKLEDALDALEDSMASLASAQKLASTGADDLVNSYGNLADEAMAVFEINRRIASVRASADLVSAARGVAGQLGVEGVFGFGPAEIINMEQTVSDLRAELIRLNSTSLEVDGMDAWRAASVRIDEVKEALENLDDVTGNIDDLTDSLGITDRQAREVVAQFAAIGQAQGPEAQAQAMLDLVSYIDGASDGLAEADEEGQDLYDSLVQASISALELSRIDVASNIASGAAAAGDFSQALWDAVSAKNALSGSGGGRGDPRSFEGDPYWLNRFFPDPENVRRGRRGGGGGGSAVDSAARDAERASDAYDRLIASMDPVAAEALKIANAQEVVSDALAAGVISADQAADAYGQIEESMRSNNSLFDSLADVGGSALDRLIDGTSSLKEALVDVAKEMLNVILKQKLMAQVGGSGSGGSVGSLLLRGLFGGFFDNGGLLATGQTGIVGENGPERITSTTRGTVVTSRSQTAREGGASGGVIMGQIGVSVDDDGKLQAYVKNMGIQAAQAGRALAVDDVKGNLSGWNRTLDTDGALS